MSTTTDNWTEVETTAKQILGEKIAAFIDQCRAGSEPESQLIAVLHKVQTQFGYLAEAHLDAVAQLMQVPAAKVAGVASFYHYYRLSPRGKFIINVCLGTACYVKGADRVAQKLIDELGITFGETSTDGIFSLEAARCLGTCGLAPVIMVGSEVHPQVTPDQVPLILVKYLDKARREAAARGSASGSQPSKNDPQETKKPAP
jgi:NADH:ubiquinone oxidoreductase subunit E